MIIGAHALIYSRDADGVRAFFRDVLGFKSVDAGGGWLIFALPPAELGVHPTDVDGDTHHEFSLMCDDAHATVAQLEKKGVTFTGPITDQGYGLVTAFRIPGGGEISLYQPKHPMAITPKG